MRKIRTHTLMESTTRRRRQRRELCRHSQGAPWAANSRRGRQRPARVPSRVQRRVSCCTACLQRLQGPHGGPQGAPSSHHTGPQRAVPFASEAFPVFLPREVCAAFSADSQQLLREAFLSLPLCQVCRAISPRRSHAVFTPDCKHVCHYWRWITSMGVRNTCVFPCA